MDMSGEYVIPAPREAVWNALNDPEILKQCIPGCEEVERTSDSGFAAKVTAKVGPVRAKFSGKVTLSEIDPPNGYTITGEGSGGAAGFAKGSAKVALSDDPGGTKLNYTVDATVGGKLAQIGSRLIDSTARKMANDFFGKFAAVVASGSQTENAAETGSMTAVTGPETPATSAMDSTIDQQSSPTADQTAPKPGIPPIAWVAGIVFAVLALLFAFKGAG